MSNSNNTQAQAQAQAQASTAVATKDIMTELTTASVMDRYGYTDSRKFEIETDKDGNKTMLVVAGDDVGVTADTATSEHMNAMDGLARFKNFENLEAIYKAWYSFKVKDLATSLNYKSAGAFIEANIDGLSATTINQYARVGELFLTADDNGNPIFNRSWLKGVKISNLVQSLKIVSDDCEKDIDHFYNEYVKTGKLNIKGSQADLKKALQGLSGSKDSKKDKDKDSGQDSKKIGKIQLTAEGHLKVAVDAVLEKIPADNAKLADKVNKAYNEIINIMISLGMIGTGTGQDKEGQDKEGQDK